MPTQYTLEQLKDASHYTSDPLLEKTGKKVAVMTYEQSGRGRTGMSAYRAEVLAGKHAEAVLEFIRRENLTGGELHKLLVLNAGKLWGIEAKYGLKIDICMSTGLVIINGAGADADLEGAVRKAGGWRTDSKTLSCKLVHADHLPSYLENWYALRRVQTARVTFAQRVKAAEKKQMPD